MNYYEDFNKFNSINTILNSRISDKNKISIGISVFNQSQSMISNKILLTRLDGFNKFSLFPYSLDKDTTNWYDPVYRTLNFYID